MATEAAPAPKPTVPAEAPDAQDITDGASARAIMAEIEATVMGADGDAPAAEASAEGAPASSDKPAVEAAPAEDKPPAEGDATALRKAWAAHAKERAKLKARAGDVEALRQKAALVDELAAGIKTSPLATIRRLGVDLDALLDEVVAGGTQKAAPTADERVAALEKRIADEAEAARVAKVTATIENWQRGVRDHVTGNAEKYDLTNALGQHDLVIATATAYAHEHGVLPDVAAVAEWVENHLSTNLAKSKKFAVRGGDKPAPPKSDPAKPAAKGKTLGLVPPAEVPSSEDGLPTNDKERYRAVLRSLNL